MTVPLASPLGGHKGSTVVDCVLCGNFLAMLFVHEVALWQTFISRNRPRQSPLQGSFANLNGSQGPPYLVQEGAFN